MPSRRVPVMVGGHSDAALRRAAGSDGWLGVDYGIAELLPLVLELIELRRREDRAGESFEVFAVLKRFSDLDTLRRMSDLGETMTQDYAWFYKGEPYSSLAHRRDSMERFADETIRAFEHVSA